MRWRPNYPAWFVESARKGGLCMAADLFMLTCIYFLAGGRET